MVFHLFICKTANTSYYLCYLYFTYCSKPVRSDLNAAGGSFHFHSASRFELSHSSGMLELKWPCSGHFKGTCLWSVKEQNKLADFLTLHKCWSVHSSDGHCENDIQALTKACSSSVSSLRQLLIFSQVLTPTNNIPQPTHFLRVARLHQPFDFSMKRQRSWDLGCLALVANC